MSRRTAAEIIASRDYLDPAFSPSVLTVPQLRGLLFHHDVKYTSQLTKAELVHLFNTEIKSAGKKGKQKRKDSLANESELKGLNGERSTDEFQNLVRKTLKPLAQALPGKDQVFDDSGWEYNNIFQSGAGISPSQPSPVHPRGSSVPPSPLKLRKPTSASPRLADKKGKETESREDESKGEEREVPRRDAVDEPVSAVSQPISKGGRVARRGRPAVKRFSSKLFFRLFIAFLAIVAFGVLYEYKHESAHIGFCDTGKTTNAILDGYRARSMAIGSCNGTNSTTISVKSVHTSSSVAPERSPPSNKLSDEHVAESCPPFTLFPHPHPQSCTPCPRHAVCTPSTLTCENGYILYPHLLLYFLPVPGVLSPITKTSPVFTRPRTLSYACEDVPELIYSGISLVLDGMPGMGSVALPPRCVKDPRLSLHIDALTKAASAMLAAEHGKRLCESVDLSEPEGNEGNDMKRWGVELGLLKRMLKDGFRDEPELLIMLDDTFDEVIQQLVQWGGVFEGEDVGGTRYLAHRTPSMSWRCATKVKARRIWKEWHDMLMGLAIVIPSVSILRRRHTRKVAERERVASLVQATLDLLYNQELAHHTDPVTAPHPYLSSVQLRDLVLLDEHSVRVRQRIWERVERVVEGNANVRTSLESKEVESGDELRAWRWVGRAGMMIRPGKQVAQRSLPASRL